MDWSSDGTSIVVLDPTAFSKNVLPRFFKHNNWLSFVRQLHIYGFKKVEESNASGPASSNDKNQVFKHPEFYSGVAPANLAQIRRNVSSVPSDSSSSARKRKRATIGDPTLRKLSEVGARQTETCKRITHLEHENRRLTARNAKLWEYVVKAQASQASANRLMELALRWLSELP